MNLHFICEKKIGTWFIDYVNRNYNHSDHFFIIISHEKYNIENDSNVFYLNKKNLVHGAFKVRKLSKEADRIHIHYLADIEIYFFVFLLRPFVKKINWGIWGGDLYKEETSRLLKRVTLFFVKRIYSISYIIEEDYDYFLEKFRIDKPHFRVAYPANIDAQAFIRITQENIKKTENEGFTVIVGNSATPENNHIQVFDYLKRVNGIARIICPLSYGDSNYARMITDKGKSIFGERFTPITTFLPLEEYLKLLCSIDFGFYGYRRQQGLGNVYPLLFMGKPVFFFHDSPLWTHFKRTIPNQTHDFEELLGVGLERIQRSFPIDEKAIHCFYDDTSNNHLWEKVFV